MDETQQGEGEKTVPPPVPAPPVPAKVKPKKARRLRKPRRRRSGLGGRLFLLFLAFGLVLAAFELSGKPIRLPVWAVAEVENRLNQGLAEALPEGAISLGGIEVVVGSDWVPHLALEDLRLLKPNGQIVLTLPATQLSLDPGGLLEGSLRAQSLRIIGARIAIRRDADGHFDFALGTGPGPHIDSLGALFAAVDRAFALPALAHLQRVEAEALSLSFADARSGRTWELGDGRLSFENRPDALAAELGLSLLGGSAPARAVFTVVAGKGQGAARITATVSNVAAADLAAQTAVLAPLGVLDAPISGRLSATLDKAGIEGMEARLDIGAGALRPSPGATPIAFDHAALALGYSPQEGRIRLTELSVQSASLRLSAQGQSYLVDGAGQIMTGALSGRRPAAFLGQIAFSDVAVDPEKVFAAPVRFSQGALDLRLRLNPFAIDIGQMTLAEGNERLTLHGQIAAEPKGWRAALDVTVNEMSLQRLLALWPPQVVPNTRRWIADNIRNVQLADVHAALRQDPGAEPRMQLGYSFNDAELRFMTKMPPVTGADGYATIVDKTYTLVMSKGIVTPPEGGGIDVSGTVFAVPDITAKPAHAEIRLRTRSSLTAALSLMDQPPFEFLSKAGKPVNLGDGTAVIEAELRIPLNKKIDVADVQYTATGTISGFSSAVLVRNKLITADSLHVQATPRGMTVAGPGHIGAVPFDVTYALGFGPGARTPTIDGTVSLSQVGVQEFGLGLPKRMVSGEGQGQVHILLPKAAPAELTLTSDLAGITLALPEVGWHKPPGGKGSLSAEVQLGTIPRVTALHVTGSGLDATGTVSFRPDGYLDVARFGSVKLAGWLNGAVDITGRGPGRAVGIAVTSGTFDLRKFPAEHGSSDEGAESSPLEASLDKLQVTDSIALTGFRGKFSLEGGFNGSFEGQVNGQAPVTGAVAPSAHGTAVRVLADDAGAVMAAAGMFSSAHGGALDMQLIPREAAGQYDGTAAVTNVRVKYASVLADLLSAISVVGLLEQLNGEGIVFAQAEAEFLLTPEAIQLNRGSAIGASLGVSMSGIYRTATAGLEMSGVISPIYLLNGIGAILTRKGEGLFGFNYTLKGTAEAPEVAVNPLSILTPGMFREIFRAPPPQLDAPGGNG